MHKSFLLGFCLSVGTGIASFAQLAPGSYVAGVWTDPDGCQHWAMDLGIEGMMSPVLTPDGKPVCGRSCAELEADVLFSTGSATVSQKGRNMLAQIATELQNAGKNSIAVVGHTDNVGTDAYNQSLSEARAKNVASILLERGVNVAGTAGFGETKPIASNASSSGRAKNRRVELMCK